MPTCLATQFLENKGLQKLPQKWPVSSKRLCIQTQQGTGNTSIPQVQFGIK